MEKIEEILNNQEWECRRWDLISNLVTQSCKDMYIDEPFEKFERVIKQCIAITDETIKLSKL